MNPFTNLTSRAVQLLTNDIDTDQIIPARFLKTTDKTGLGANLFFDWRYLPDGSPNPNFVLNQTGSQGAHILLAGHNFGCGSSREHAPWALWGYGFRAVIATSFADIFRNNALKNGLLPVVLEPDAHARLLQVLQNAPQTLITISLAIQEVSLPDGQRFSFPLESFSRTCLLSGLDELGYLLKMNPQITAFENSLAAAK